MRAPRLFDFLEPLIPRLAARSAYDLDLSEDSPFAIQGALGYLGATEFYVVARYIASGGMPPAAPVSPASDERLGRLTAPYFNNKSNFLRVGGPNEAWFVAAFVNVPATQSLIGRIAMSTTISPRKLASIPIPNYDEADDRHRDLARLGMASTTEKGWAANVEVMDRLVLSLGREVLATAPRGATSS